MSECKYCGTYYDDRRIGFGSTCHDCEKELIKIQIPYVEAIEKYRERIKNHEKQIETLYKAQIKDMNKKADEMLEEKNRRE